MINFEWLESTTISNLTTWIEDHGNTVDLLKWVAILIAAWLLGAFKYLKAKFRRATATLNASESRCLVEEINTTNEKTRFRLSFLVEMGVLNPTTERLVVRTFSLAVRKRSFWRAWTYQLSPISLPARPQMDLADGGRKFMKNWFSKFHDGFEDLTLSGHIETKEHHSGFLFFVLFDENIKTFKQVNEYIEVRGKVFLTTGEVCTVKKKIKITRNINLLESRVPGIASQIRHPSSWGINHEI